MLVKFLKISLGEERMRLNIEMSPGRGVPTLGLWSFSWHLTACSSLNGGGWRDRSGSSALPFPPQESRLCGLLQTDLTVVKILFQSPGSLCLPCAFSYKQPSLKEKKSWKMSSSCRVECLFLSRWEQKGVPRAFMGRQPSSWHSTSAKAPRRLADWPHHT